MENNFKKQVMRIIYRGGKWFQQFAINRKSKFLALDKMDLDLCSSMSALVKNMLINHSLFG